jgi:hypothetical protein
VAALDREPVVTWFLVDCEATNATPVSGVMTEFGVVELMTLESFHGVLWDSMPSPENPAIPVLTGAKLYDPQQVLRDLDVYLHRFPKPWVLVSDNPAYDFMWMACWFDEMGVENPFGHSGRRIGDYAAGLAEVWTKTSAWKRMRKTEHTHNPVDDAMGNAEALRSLLDIS